MSAAWSGPATARRYLIDHSVWTRIHSSRPVALALGSIVESARPGDVLVCPPIVLELGFSARSGSDHALLTDSLDAFGQCYEHPTVDDVMTIQGLLWSSGLVRAAGVVDVLIAAYALANGAAVVHYDRDFDHIASVIPELETRWIVPRGSVE